MSRYVRRPDWPVSPTPPWSEADVEAIKAWQKTLSPDRAELLRECRRAKDTPGDDDGFWRIHGEHTPDELAVTGFEQAVMAGEKVSAADLRDYVARSARLRTEIVTNCLNYLPGWLVGQNVEEIKRRCHAAILDGFIWFTEFGPEKPEQGKGKRMAAGASRR